VSDSTSKPSGPFCQKCHRDMSGDVSLYLYGALHICIICHFYATAPSDLDRLQKRLEIAEGLVRDVANKDEWNWLGQCYAGCGGHNVNAERNERPHSDTCFWLRARAYVAEHLSPEPAYLRGRFRCLACDGDIEVPIEKRIGALGKCPKVCPFCGKDPSVAEHPS
jgi:hypothetical protein